SVTVTGTNLLGASAVVFGSTAASSYAVDSGTQITAVSPAQPASTVDVTVTTPSGTSSTSAADQFTYGPAPTIASMSPGHGPWTGRPSWRPASATTRRRPAIGPWRPTAGSSAMATPGSSGRRAG